MDAELLEKIGSVFAFVIGLGAMLAVTFGVFKLIDWARETRRIAEEALEAKSENTDRSGDPEAR